MNRADANQIARDLQLLYSARTRTVRFHGLSMHPFLRDGDRVTVEEVPWEEIRRGDIVTYRGDSRYPTRRVVRKQRDRVRLWCDNWPDLRFTATREEVLGRAVALERGASRLHVADPDWQRATRRALRAYRAAVVRRVSHRLRRAAGVVWRAPQRLLRR